MLPGTSGSQQVVSLMKPRTTEHEYRYDLDASLYISVDDLAHRMAEIRLTTQNGSPPPPGGFGAASRQRALRDYTAKLKKLFSSAPNPNPKGHGEFYRQQARRRGRSHSLSSLPDTASSTAILVADDGRSTGRDRPHRGMRRHVFQPAEIMQCRLTQEHRLDEWIERNLTDDERFRQIRQRRLERLFREEAQHMLLPTHVCTSKRVQPARKDVGGGVVIVGWSWMWAGQCYVCMFPWNENSVVGSMYELRLMCVCVLRHFEQQLVQGILS